MSLVASYSRRPTLTASAEDSHPLVTHLASRRRCTERISAAWPGFLNKREQRLEQQRRLGEASEKVAEDILEDLFTTVLDWKVSDLNNQVQYADIVLTALGIKNLIVEVKRPGSLAWSRRAVENALTQVSRYACEQKVKVVAVSDGDMLYAANLVDGGLCHRAFASLRDPTPPFDLWWLSVQGIWREPEPSERAQLRILPAEPLETPAPPEPNCGATLLHPKYHLPADCFAYVGDYGKPSSWKLPYLLADRTVDAKRLPKAVQCILTNYRGARVSGIPEASIPAVLLRLANAARHAGHMPPEACNPAPVYRQLADTLEQLDITRDD